MIVILVVFLFNRYTQSYHHSPIHDFTYSILAKWVPISCMVFYVRLIILCESGNTYYDTCPIMYHRIPRDSMIYVNDTCPNMYQSSTKPTPLYMRSPLLYKYRYVIYNGDLLIRTSWFLQNIIQMSKGSDYRDIYKSS